MICREGQPVVEGDRCLDRCHWDLYPVYLFSQVVRKPLSIDLSSEHKCFMEGCRKEGTRNTLYHRSRSTSRNGKSFATQDPRHPTCHISVLVRNKTEYLIEECRVFPLCSNRGSSCKDLLCRNSHTSMSKFKVWDQKFCG